MAAGKETVSETETTFARSATWTGILEGARGCGATTLGYALPRRPNPAILILIDAGSHPDRRAATRSR